MKKIQPNRWHAVSGEETARAFSVDPNRGFSETEAARRRRKQTAETLWRTSSVSPLRILLRESMNLSAVLLALTAIVAAAFEHSEDAVLLCALLVVSAFLRTGVGVVAERIFYRMKKENIPRAHVLRAGKCVVIPAHEVVPGDVLILLPGDTVVCDARMYEGTLTVSEEKVGTGNRLCEKQADTVLSLNTLCENRTNTVFAASHVIRGRARAVAIAVGEHTYTYAVHGPVVVAQTEEVGIFQTIAGWCRTTSLLMLAGVLGILLAGLFLQRTSVTIDTLFLAALSLAVSSMGEFMEGVAAMILACSVYTLWHSSQKQCFLKNPSSLETFARTDAIVFSSASCFLSNQYSIAAWYWDGRQDADGSSPNDNLLFLLRLSALCSGANLPTASAVAGGRESDVSYDLLRSLCDAYFPKESLTLSDFMVLQRAYDGCLHTVLTKESVGTFAYVCGSLSDVLSCCSCIRKNGRIEPLFPAEKESLLAYGTQQNHHGVDVVAIAVRVSPFQDLKKISMIQTRMTLLGYYAVANPISASSAQYVSRCRAGHIRLFVLDEKPERAQWICSEAGILASSDCVISGDISASAENLSVADGNALFVCHGFAEKKQVLSQIRKICEHPVYVGTEAGDLACFREAAASVGMVEEEKTPLCVDYAADAVVRRKNDSEKTQEPVQELFRLIGYARNAMMQVRGAAEYLVFSQVLRVVLLFSSVCFGIPMLSPRQILLWGLILDFSAVIVRAFEKPRLRVLRVSAERTYLPDWKHGLAFAVLAGAFGGFCVALFPGVLYLAEATANDAVVVSMMFSAGVLSSFAASLGLTDHRASFRSEYRLNLAAVLHAVFSVFCCTISMVRSGFFQSGLHCLWLAVPCFPAVAVHLLSLIYTKTVSAHKNQNKTEL